MNKKKLIDNGENIENPLVSMTVEDILQLETMQDHNYLIKKLPNSILNFIHLYVPASKYQFKKIDLKIVNKDQEKTLHYLN